MTVELATYDLPGNLSEQWRSISVTRGCYEVSDQGNVRSWLPNRGRFGPTQEMPFLMSPRIGPQGYRAFAALDNSGKRHHLTVHRQVALAFLGAPPAGKPFALHADGDKLNNLLSNLRWGSARDNWDDLVLHGTLGIGDCGFRALTDAQVKEIRLRHAAGETQAAMAVEYGVGHATISRAVSGNRRAA